MTYQVEGVAAAFVPASQWEAFTASVKGALQEALPGLVREAYPENRSALLRKAEVADRLAVSERTVDNLVAAGDLRPVSIGRARRFVSAQVDAFVRGLTRRG